MRKLKEVLRLRFELKFVFTPESFSRSPRNPVRLPPESAKRSRKRWEFRSSVPGDSRMAV
jgi:hypothetical protein